MSQEERSYSLRGQEPLTMEGSRFVNSNIAESSVFQGNVSTAGGAVNISLSGPVLGEVKEIVHWLSPGLYNETHVAISEQRQENTGQWFIDEVRKWLAEPGSQPIFWCRGIPGAGKTVLMSKVVDDILSKPQVGRIDGIAYIYFNYKQQESQTLPSIYASMVAQLVHQMPVLQGTVKGFHKEHDSGKKAPSAEELFRILSSLPSSCQVVLAFDALDEASAKTREGLIKQLKQLENRSLLIFLTSRPDVQLKSVRDKTRLFDLRANHSDLEAFARAKLQGGEAQDILDGDSECIISEIIEEVISHAADMFLLVAFQISHICSQTCASEMLKAARTMPSDPGSIYARTMEQIASQSESQAQLANKVLLWLVLAKRNLTAPELVEALAVELNTPKLDPHQKRTPAMLLKVCRGLVVTDDKSNVIRLAHLTVQEYLASSLPDIRNMQEKITLTCLAYLSFDVFADGNCTSDVEMETRLQRHPFLSYAARYWGDHAQGVPESRIKDSVLKFLKLQAKVSCCIQAAHIPEFRYRGYTQYFPTNVTGLQVAASFGLVETTGILLGAGVDVNATDSFDRTALQAAAEGGHVEVVERLLAAGADVNAAAADYGGRTALKAAAQGGRVEVIERLLAAGAEVNATDSFGETALQAAAQGGHVEVVERLLAAGADINVAAAPEGGQTVLQAAAQGGHVEVVEKLLAAGADVNAAAADYGGRTALQEAAQGGHVEVVERLLAAGADINAAAADYDGRTALQAAAQGGRFEVIERLLAAGADVNAAAAVFDGRTALQVAAQGGHVEVVERLLAAGANVNAAAADYGGRTALQVAAQGGHVEVVERLLAAGADVNAADSFGETALQAAAYGGHVEVVERLLAAGTDVDAAYSFGRTALVIAVERGHTQVAERLKSAQLNEFQEAGRLRARKRVRE